MPNHVANIIGFNDVDDNRISEILEVIKNDEEEIGSIDFNKIIPMSDEVFKGNLGREEMEQYGSNNWYDWSIGNWGTKWNAYHFCEYDAENGNIEFSTAWSAPHPILQKLSEMYPDIEIEHKWADEDLGYNCGERNYKSGEIIFENVPHGGSKEAYELAADIQGYDLEEKNYRLSDDGTTYDYVDDEPDERMQIQ